MSTGDENLKMIMAEVCKCGNNLFKVFEDPKFKHVWITCSVCGEQKEIK